MAPNIIQNLQFYKRLNAYTRFNLIMKYPVKALRCKDDCYQLIIRNQNKNQVWLPIDYCMGDTFTDEQREKIKARIESKN